MGGNFHLLPTYIYCHIHFFTIQIKDFSCQHSKLAFAFLVNFFEFQPIVIVLSYVQIQIAILPHVGFLNSNSGI